MRTHLSLVNQKLGFASTLLLLAKNFPETESGLKKTQKQACCEASVSFLYVAYHFYLRELAENNRVKNFQAINSIEALGEMLSQIGSSPSEVNEVQDLVNDNGSWLSQMLMQYTSVFTSPLHKKEKKAFGNDNLIELIELGQTDEASSQVFEVDVIEGWLVKFRALIARQRETGAEY
ncbi:MAG TPA: DUF6586 family protein [Cellvibrio sp.]|nr:DUF6586 family protein [Cellvibrio sp.]